MVGCYCASSLNNLTLISNQKLVLINFSKYCDINECRVYNSSIT